MKRNVIDLNDSKQTMGANCNDAPGDSSPVLYDVGLLNIHDVFTGQAWLPCLLFGHDSATQSRGHVVLCGFNTSWPVLQLAAVFCLANVRLPNAV
jgi:hypothetical protein